MRYNRSAIDSLVVCGTALMLGSSLAAQTIVETGAKVVHVNGAARYTLGHNVWKPLELGMVLKAGSVIQTGKDYHVFVDLVLGDAAGARPPRFRPFIPSSFTSYLQPAVSPNVIRILNNSALGIDKMTSMQTGAGEVTETELDLKAGKILGSVRKVSAGSKYEIKLPYGLASTRGGAYWINAEGTVSVISGMVVVSYTGPNGQVRTQTIRAGQCVRLVGIGTLPWMPPDPKDIASQLAEASWSEIAITTATNGLSANNLTIENSLSPTTSSSRAVTPTGRDVIHNP